jgi:hypothetical protein
VYGLPLEEQVEVIAAMLARLHPEVAGDSLLAVTHRDAIALHNATVPKTKPSNGSTASADLSWLD